MLEHFVLRPKFGYETWGGTPIINAKRCTVTQGCYQAESFTPSCTYSGSVNGPSLGRTVAGDIE